MFSWLNGGIYKYLDVPESIYKGLKEAGSVGQYFNSNIREKFGCDHALRASEADREV